MYKVLIYDNKYSLKKPITWFNGIFSKNEIPFKLIHSETNIRKNFGQTIINKGEYYIKHTIKDIIRIENAGENKSLLFIDKNTFYTCSKSINEFEKELKNNGFFRVHNKHIVNIKHLESIVNCDAYILLSNSDTVPVQAPNNILISNFLENKKIIL